MQLFLHKDFAAGALIARLTGYAGEQVFMLSADAILNIDTLSELLASGHSRVPVHVPGNRYVPPPHLAPFCLSCCLCAFFMLHVSVCCANVHNQLPQQSSTAALHPNMAFVNPCTAFAANSTHGRSMVLPVISCNSSCWK